MEQTKPWWTSKTIWVNCVALAGSIALAYGMDEGSWAEISATVLAVVNLGLRLVSNSGVTLKQS